MSNGFGFGPQENYALKPMSEAVDMIVSEVRQQREIEREEDVRQQDIVREGEQREQDIEREDIQRTEDIERKTGEMRTKAQLDLLTQRYKEAETPEEKSDILNTANEILGGPNAISEQVLKVPERYIQTPKYLKEFFGDMLPEEFREEMPEGQFKKLVESAKQVGGLEKIEADVKRIKASTERQKALTEKTKAEKPEKKKTTKELIDTIKVLKEEIDYGEASNATEYAYRVLLRDLINRQEKGKEAMEGFTPSGDPITMQGPPEYGLGYGGVGAEDDLENYLEGYNE